jgi:bacteriocin biosynthesis cyclodehydratase domain-containing protein
MTAPTAPAEPLPTLRIRPGTPVLDRGDGRLQLGTDPRWALVLSGLSSGESAWLREAAGRRHRSLRDAARRHRVDDARQAEITDLLVRCGYLVSPSAADAEVTAPARGAADIAVLGALRPDGAGLATLARRAGCTVGISGLGRTGSGIALHLATAGVGTVVLGDRRPVQVTDLGLGIYRQDDVGRPRERVLRDVLGERSPRTTACLELDADGQPDVVVVIEAHAADPRRYERLVGAGIAHLAVVVREADMVVGPLVLPGRSPCVRCCDLHATDVDRDWPELAGQLWKEHAESGVPEETTLAASAAAMAAAQVLAQLDGARPAAVGAVIEIALPEALPRVRRVLPHPRCGCSTLPG